MTTKQFLSGEKRLHNVMLLMSQWCKRSGQNTV